MRLNKEEFLLDYKSNEELSYIDKKGLYVQLFFNGVLVGKLYVYTDFENNSREYILINYSIVYLDTLNRIRQ
jgi:hypothetical protein